MLTPIAAPRRKRGPSLARRRYQQGYVYQKGRKRHEPWLSDCPGYFQYWKDMPSGSKRVVLPLGSCRTRTIAERAAALKLEQLGVNSTQHFIESTSGVTFRRQGELWLQSLAARKRNPIEQTTINNRRYALDKWLYPFFGVRTLGEVNNRAMRELVEYMSRLSAATIRDYSNIAKDVVASAIDENGEEMFPRKWNEEYIDAPPIVNQRQPTINRDEAIAIFNGSVGRGRMLTAILAGCGPLRVGEALGLEIDKHISDDFRTLYIRQKVKRGVVYSSLKTAAGQRDVDLCLELAEMLREFISGRRSGFVFCTQSGRPWGQRNALRDWLHSTERRIGLPEAGFNIFRRFRRTHLDTHECPTALANFWSGHASEHVSERYIKLLGDRAYRLEWAERIGMGFLPSTGLPGLLHLVRKSA